MWRGMIVGLTLALTAAAVTAQHPTNRRLPRSPGTAVASPSGLVRQGGDTVLDALTIAGLPYDTTGTTTGYADDYDEVCPYDAPGSPDVVYSYVPPSDQLLTVDMLGSAYDTKIYIYDEFSNLVACNDDYYGDYVSKLEEVPVQGGAQIFLVIDGYGGEHGAYTLAMSEVVPPHCNPIAGCYARVEDEPPLVDGYVDMYNSGCNGAEFGAPFLDLPPPDPYYGRSEVAGTVGWYLDPEGQMNRDTDWYQGTAWGVFEVEIEASVPIILFLLQPGESCGYSILDYWYVDTCEPQLVVVDPPAGHDYWFVVAPQSYDPPTGWDGEEEKYRVALGFMLPSCLFMGPDSDYTYDCVPVELEYQGVSFDSEDCVHDVDLAEICGELESTPGGDAMASVYLAAGQSVNLNWFPYYIALDDPSRMPSCFALVTDMRTAMRSCADAIYLSGYNVFGSLTAQQEGWHWLVIDATHTGHNSHWGYVGVTPTEPPAPPAHDACDGAIAIPRGSFAFDDDLTEASNQFDPGRDGCLDAPWINYTSRDVVYRIDLLAQDRLDVVMDPLGDWEASMYLVRDCEEPVGMCVASAQREDEVWRLTYTALDAETLWLVCDSWRLGDRPFRLSGSLDAATSAPGRIQHGLALWASPNPFNPRTTIRYELPRATPARLRIHDLEGHTVATLFDGQQSAGRHEITWSGRDRAGRPVPSGVYLARLEAGDQARSIRVTAIK